MSTSTKQLCQQNPKKRRKATTKFKCMFKFYKQSLNNVT